MNKQNDAIDEGGVDSQHQTIMQGGKIEEFADALGRFCRVEGWKKLKDEKSWNGKNRSLFVLEPANKRLFPTLSCKLPDRNGKRARCKSNRRVKK